MSVLFQTALNVGKLSIFRKTLNVSKSSCECLGRRKYSERVINKFQIFDDVVSQRRAEARRSIVVQVNSDSSFNELYGYCSKYASIEGIHHYKNTGGEHFMLIEFTTEDNVREVLRMCSTHQKDLDVMALQSPFLWFRAAHNQKKKENSTPPKASLITKEGNLTINEEALYEELMTCETISDQIQLLYDRTALNDLGVRLRYMVARQLEVIFESLYSNIAVYPFGSSVNGFGKLGCDLDLVLTNSLSEEMKDHQKRLIYHEKKCESGRSPWQRHMELVGELVELRVPGAARVTRILHARVPIVKYAHELTALDCDLCYSNMSGVYMSELLWLYGSLDPRVRPLTFAVRRWAQTVGLTNSHPGRWITNFPLTLMVLFFLQQKTTEGHILPSFKYLVNRAGKNDLRVAEDNLNCTFLRDLNLLPSDSYGQNESSLETLLLQFFEFYSQFDFQDKAISVVDGVPVRKPSALPLYVVNPLDQSLNVSRNVSYEECERFKMEVRNAAWQLESCTDKERGDDWGLLGLLEKRSTRGLKRLLRVGNSQRLVSVKDLFSEKEDEPVETYKNKLRSLTNKSDKEVNESVKEMKQGLTNKTETKGPQKLKFKNTQVANEVYRIRRNKMV